MASMNSPHLRYTLALHRELSGDADLVWSPYSVASALGLAAAGARGATRDELARALVPGGGVDDLSRLLSDSVPLRDAEVAVANSLWARSGVRFRESYLDGVGGWPGVAMNIADFRNDPEGSRLLINTDIERTTHGLIKELLAAGAIDRETVAVLVNALRLRVAWRVAFAEEATRPRPFHAPAGTRDVPMMHQQERLGYAATAGWRMVTLPTVSEVAVDILLPEADSPPTAELLTELWASSAPTKVDLGLPRFRAEASTALNGPLERLGIATAFTHDADFTGMTETEQIRIDKAVHKAVLRVDERGFEGAAATGLVMRAVALDLSAAVSFLVDRPFLVVVRHTRTGAIFFVARVAEP